jgi:hypothetical protein
VYGNADRAAFCALMMRDAAISSMARVIFFVVLTDRRRSRSSRRLLAID